MAVFREEGAVVIICTNGVRKSFLASCILGGYTTCSQSFIWLKGASEEYMINWHGNDGDAEVRAINELREVLSITNEINCEHEKRYRQ